MSSHITYGRRAHKRRRRLIDSDDESEGQDDTDAIPPPPAPRSARKRPRMQVEVVVPLSPASKRKPSSSNPVLNDVAIGETYASTSLDVAQSGPHASSSKGSISMAQGSSKSSVGPRDQDSLASLRAQLKREKGFKEHSRAVESASRSQADRLTTPSTELAPRSATPPFVSSTPSPSTPPRTRVTYLSRTPLKASASLPASSPLTSAPPTPLKRTHTTPIDSSQITHSHSPKAPAKDLANLFDFLPSTSQRQPAVNAPQRRKTKPVAKRMLARTRTEPSVDANSIVGSFGSRTAITISSNDTPPRHHPPLRHDTVISITTSGSGTTQSSLVSDESSQHLAAGPSTGVHQSNIRTYAGKSRSFLVELPTGSFPGGAEEDDLGFEVRESYTDLRTRWGVDNSEDDPRPVSPSNSLPERDDHTENGHGAKGKGKGKDKPRISKVVLPPGMMNDLKSITELRSKGESRRFMDEVGYLFEGMGATAGIGVRRGSALEIVTKLCDPDFSRRAKATDFLSRAWDILRSAGAGDGDRILDSILIFFAALAAQSPRDLQELTNKPDFVATLWRMLPSVERGKDPITFLSGNFNDSELKKAGIGKSEKRMLASLSIAIVEKSGLSTSTACPPLRQLLSQALSAIPPSSHNLSQFSSLYETLILELELLPSRISAYAAGLSLLPEVSVPTRLQDLPQFEHVDNCLSILDSFLLGRWPDSDEPCDQSDDVVNGVDQEALGDGLISLCTACNILLSGELHEDFAPIATRCLESSLRVLINLSHENLVWCRLLLHNEYTIPIVMSLIVNAQHNTPPAEIDEKPEVAEEGSRDARAFDRLCLALGLLTNLVQADDTAKDICRQTKLNASCPGSRLCARSCHCPARTNALDCLVQAYVHHRKLAADDEDPGISIVRGHLAVLLGLLMRESTPNERIVLTALPGTSQRAKLDSLVEAACEFVTLYTDFMARVARGEDQGEDHEDHLDDADRSSDAERHKAIQDRTSGVAKDVILFLEMLRDQ